MRQIFSLSVVSQPPTVSTFSTFFPAPQDKSKTH
jgi:hypothetical protein